jgi:hypothetical protein
MLIIIKGKLIPKYKTEISKSLKLVKVLASDFYILNTYSFSINSLIN